MREVVSNPTLDSLRAECAELMVRISTLNAQLAALEIPTAKQPDANLTVEQAAERLNVSVGWLYKNWKKIPGATKLSHRQLRFSERGLERYQRMRTAA